MMFGLAIMFRPVIKNFTLCNDLVIKPNTIEYKIFLQKYIELVSKLTMRGLKWNFINALLLSALSRESWNRVVTQSNIDPLVFNLDTNSM